MANAEGRQVEAASPRARIEQSVLDAATAGPSRPPSIRLRAAADHVIDRTRPGQLILFGSAARGEFADGSDFDFLVVLPPGAERPRFLDSHRRWECPETGDEIDVLFAGPDLLEERRWTAGTVHCSVLTEGVTVFAAPGAAIVETARDAGAEVVEMVRSGRYKPDKAAVFMAQARDRLNGADDAIERDAGALACELLQGAAERALKALIIANRSPFAYIHELSELWDAAEAVGERIEAQRDDRVLAAISAYAGRLGYDAPSAHESIGVFNSFRQTAGDILNYAERRVRELVPGSYRSA